MIPTDVHLGKVLEYDNIPITTLSIPIINNTIEISTIILKTASPGYAIANTDNMTESTPILIRRSLNQVGGLLVTISSSS